MRLPLILLALTAGSSLAACSKPIEPPGKIAGAYQSNFLFLVSAGIYTSTSWEGGRFLALVRSGDGRLVIPGAMPMSPEP